MATNPKALNGFIKAIFFILILSYEATAQNEVAIGSTTTKSNAILWLNGNGSQGLILPVVTNRASVVNPDKGMIVYDNADNKLWYRNDNTWVEVGAGGGSTTTNLNLQLQGNQLQLRDGTTVLNSANIATGTQSNGSFLVFNGTSWQYATLSGDVSGANGSLQVNGIRGKTVGNLPATSQALIYDPSANSGSGAWVFQPITASSSVTNVTGTAPINVATGNSTPVISIAQANGTTSGFLSSADHTTFSGKVSLAGDLGGTAANPTVTKIQGVNVSSTPPALNQVLQYNGTNWLPATLTTSSGTVNSVGLTLPSIFTVSNSPITTSGSLTGTLTNQNANTIFAAPSGSIGVPSFRSLVAADVPNLDASKITTGTFAVVQIPNLDATKITTGIIPTTQGGTGLNFSSGSFANGELLIGTTGGFSKATLNQGNGINITNGAGTISIATSGNFGSQNLITTGTLNAGATTVSGLTIGTSAWPSNSSGVLTNDGTGTLSWIPTGGTGTVTSVGLTMPAIFSVTNSPVTTSGTLTTTLTSQTAATVFAAPAGSAGTPTFRALTATDIPSLDVAKITSGILSIANGGTGSTTAAGALTNLGALGTTTTAGGDLSGTFSNLQLVSGTVVDTDINIAAAIAGTKVTPAFGTQNISTTGTLSAGATTVTGLTINGAAWPANASGVLTNNGSGTLTWGAALTNPMTTAGDLIYRDGTGPQRLPTGTGFLKGGATPSYSAINLASADVSGTLAITNGGTGATSAAVALTNLGAIGTATTAGGDLSGTFSNLQLVSGTIVDADVSPTAAIAGTKVSPSFGAQNITTTGTINAGATTVSGLTIGTSAWPSNSSGTLTNDGTGTLSWTPTGGTGTVTSVGLTMPSIFSVTNSPVTTSGTLTTTLTSQTAATVFAAPSGVDGAPSFRTLTATDIPALDAAKITSGILSIANGGTGSTTAAGALTNLGALGTATTAGGDLSGTFSNLQLVSGTVVDADINASAAIAGTKVAPAFGAQNISTSGTLAAGATTVTGLTINGAAWPANASGVLTNNGSGTLTWGAAFTNPMTTPGDIIYGGVSGAATRLPTSTGFLKGGATPTYSAINLASTDVTGALAITNGGTGSITAAGALTNLGAIGTATTAGGDLSGTFSNLQLVSGTVVDADINATAAIAGTKVVPSFGTQNILTTGTLTTGSTGQFTVNATGNITKLNNLTTSFPTVQGANGSVLTNDGTGNLSWTSSTSGWSLTGNAGINPATNFIGTTDAQPLRFSTGVGGLERMRIDATGRVGIGTTNPIADFVVSKENATTNTGVFSYSGNATQSPNFYLIRSRGTQATPAALQSGDNMGTMGFIGETGGGISEPSASIDVTALENFTGSAQGTEMALSTIGIGEATPSKRLVIDGAGAVTITNLATGGSTEMVVVDANGLLTSQAISGSGWILTGNAGTVDGTNFIGTTDTAPLNFRRNNVTAGRIDGTGSTFFGYQSGNAHTTATSNSGFGYASLFANTTGTENTASGAQAMTSNTTGNKNSAFGRYALYLNTAGIENSAVGFNALSSNTTGNYNVASGSYALYSNVAGSNATAIGTNAMQYANDTATPFTNQNVAVGFEALRGSTTASANTGNYNAVLGFQALRTNTAGEGNVAVGYRALMSNTTGLNNTSLGTQSLMLVTSGNNNTAVGTNSLGNNNGDQNTAIGSSVMYGNTSGDQNTASGLAAMFSNQTGSLNTAYGYWALHSNVAGSNATAIGTNAMQYANNTVTPFVNANVAVGFEALRGSATPSANTGNDNTSIGFMTLRNNASGNGNVAVGAYSLTNNTTGSFNVAQGQQALTANTIGTQNTAMGYQALGSNIIGGNNSAFGFSSLVFSTGNFNVAHGSLSLSSNTSGGNNTAVGYQAGYTSTPANANTSGSNNTFIGYNSGPGTSTQLTNATAIGANALVSQSNSLALGGTGADAVNVGIGTTTPSTRLHVNSNTNEVARFQSSGDLTVNFYKGATQRFLIQTPGTTDAFLAVPAGSGTFNLFVNSTNALSISTTQNTGLARTATTNRLEVNGEASKTVAGSWVANSDARIKKDIQEISNSLEIIKKLRPVKFKYTREWMNRNESIKDQYYYNFIAQEFKEVFPDAVKGSGEYLDGDPEEILQIDTYSAQITAISAIQELLKKVEELEKENQKLKKENDKNLEGLVLRIDQLSTEILKLKTESFTKTSKSED